MKLIESLKTFSKNDEWYTDQTAVMKCYEILDPKPNSTIFCPFDTEKSNFVKVGQSLGHKVLYGIRDFLDAEDYEFDYLITNPPFSIKDKVIEKIYFYQKPSTIILPIDAIAGARRSKLYRDYGFPEIYIPTKRMHFIDETNTQKQNAYFHTVIMTFNRGTGITWE
jgi:hypothetical protein